MTTLAQPIVKAAAGDEHGRLLTTLTTAFADDPAVRWLYPDQQRYLAYFPRFAHAFGGKATQLGTALCETDYAGAALWLPPGQHPDAEGLMALLQETIPKQRQPEVVMLLAEMSMHRPEEAHWYLPLVGVEPARQGQGVGSALLRPMLADCDRDGLPAYLEATNPRNVSLYMRHGFEVVAVIRSGSCPPITSMVRTPRGG